MTPINIKKQPKTEQRKKREEAIKEEKRDNQKQNNGNSKKKGWRTRGTNGMGEQLLAPSAGWCGCHVAGSSLVPNGEGAAGMSTPVFVKHQMKSYQAKAGVGRADECGRAVLE